MGASTKGKRGQRRRMGRPPRPAEQVRSNRVTATFTGAELKQLTKMADEKGLPVGTLLYQLVKRSLKRRK